MQTELPTSFHQLPSTVEPPLAAATSKETKKQQTKQQVPSTNSGRTADMNNLGHLEHIFQSVKKQIEQWGENAKWKIDLILLDNNSTNQQQQKQLQQPAPPQRKNSVHPLLSPQLLHPNAITTPADSHTMNYNSSYNASIPITSTVQYPWDFVAPKYLSEIGSSYLANPDLQAKLHESAERQKYLENIIWSQAEQLKQTTATMNKDVAVNNAVNTMKDIYLFAQNEQKLQYLTETNMLRSDIDKLSTKLKNMAHILEKMEQYELPTEDSLLDKEALLADRKQILRKLHLAELRLTARDSEIEYLHEITQLLKSTAHSNHYYRPSMYPPSPRPFHQPQYSSGNHHNRKYKDTPYLLQQQFSPYSSSATTSEVRSSEPQHPLSALDSLGIVADQMLSDPEFDNNPSSFKSEAEEDGEVPEKRFRTRLNDRRSQRSMDSAATLLAMPQLMFPPQRSALSKVDDMSSSTSSSPSPEQLKVTSIDQVPKKPRSTYTRWTEAEDKLLRAAVKKYGHSNWEACARDIKGRSNIQCRNRWIRHLEHKPAPIEEAEEDAEADEEKEDEDEQPPLKRPKKSEATAPAAAATSGVLNNSSARHSPSIAALLNSDASEKGNKSPYLHPTAHPYTPPSPMQSPKHRKRRTEAEGSDQKVSSKH